ncbi:glycosyltransferase [Microbacterium sp. P01]|uniref:glycosyltransferase n=1 Tax=unclassified Microbacterium TaxID=2609290 RepID=UPI0036715AB0
MRVALLAETFLPHMNGVTGSVLQVLQHLQREGHDALVIAPGSPENEPTARDVHGARTALLRSAALPSYPEVRLAFARTAHLTRVLAEFDPHVVHLASPFVLGWQGVQAARALAVPSVAVYQTDVIAYAEKYRVPGMTAFAAAHVARLHRHATLTLAPSSAAEAQLQSLGVDRLRRWGRGVDAERFAPARRSERWRREVAPGEIIVGYVGRLAPEKQVEDLAALADLPGVRLVIVGDGPSRSRLESLMPRAVFTGFLGGAALAEALASFDVFVHPGESETFCQTVQEALASGVPVVAVGRGGPVDLVRSSVDGWLYRPGDLHDLRARVADLTGDEAKRRSFGIAARASVRDRTWAALGDQLLSHYDEARMLRPIDDALVARAATRPVVAPRPAAASGPRPARWARYVALGDSITEGLCDSSRMPDGQYRGWADRLALLLAHARQGGERFRYANLAVRSRRVRDVVNEQIPAAIALRPQLVSVLIGANDLLRVGADPAALARELEEGVRMLRTAGCDVLLVTPFLPRRSAARVLAGRFAAFASELRAVAARTEAILLDVDALPGLGELGMWAEDRVHLQAVGHRFLAYRAAEVLGVPDAEALGALDAALHADDEPASAALASRTWLRRHAIPWAMRRMVGRSAGDGVSAKHEGYVELRPRRRSSSSHTDA